VDIGGESTRPGTDPVDADEELRRVLPVLRALVRSTATPISVDTYKADVARAAIAEGAVIINDISGLLYEPALAGVVAEGQAALVLMHMRGRPKTMYAEAGYRNVLAEVSSELQARVEAATAAGVCLDRIIVDPGIGFAKRAADSYEVLANVPAVAAALGRPVLVGPSRKSFMRAALDDRPPLDRDWGTAAAVTAAVLGGAHILRVHAVAEMTQVVRVAEEIRKQEHAR
jgi:dihydropteroate synthase